MKHRTLVPAAAALALALTGCSDTASRDDAEEFNADESEIASLLEGGEEGVPETPEELVPAQVPAPVVDAEGTVIGNVLVVEGALGGPGETGGTEGEDPDGVQVRVRVAGLTEGFHPMQLLDTAVCPEPGSPAEGVVLGEPLALPSLGGTVPPGTLPPLLVTETGVGLITVLVGEVELDEHLLDEDGSALVIYPALDLTADLELDQGAVVLGEAGSELGCAQIGGPTGNDTALGTE